jgi:hypothetical protein
MSAALTDSLGWTATAVFVGSYFSRRPAALCIMQMCGAALWIVYGLLIRSTPVIAANALVLASAAWTTFSSGRSLSDRRPHDPIGV